MKYLLSVTLLLVAFSAIAQPTLSKDEKKQLQKEIANLAKDLEGFGKQKKELAKIEESVKAKNAQLLQKKADAQNMEKSLAEKDESIAYYEEQLRKIQKDRPEVNATSQERKMRDCMFSVQIGAYKSKDLSQYLDNNPNFIVEQGENGLKKYMLGYFTSYWEAKNFSKYLDKAGAISYVVGYYKKNRVPDLKDMTQCTF